MKPDKSLVDQIEYLYTLEKEFVYQSSKLKGLSFKCDWLELKPDGTAIVPKEYSWDGCSPKWRICGFVFGTPEGDIEVETGKPRTYYASLVHDALYQFMEEIAAANNLSPKDVKKIADKILLDILLEHKFKLAYVYYYAVKYIGGIYHSSKKALRKLL